MTLALIIVVIVWLKPFDYRAVVIVSQEQQMSADRPVLSPPESEQIQFLRDKGIALTPTEYTNNIVSYYNTLIAFLAIFFIVFTVLGYFAISSQSKKEVKEEAREILLDSSTFRKDVIETIKGEFDESYLSHEEYDGVLKSMQEDIATLKTKREDTEKVVPAIRTPNPSATTEADQASSKGKKKKESQQ